MMRKVIWSLCLFCLPLFVSAASVEVTDFLVDAQILEDGDMIVREIIVADGSFNWFERDLLYTNDTLELTDSFANNAIYNAGDIKDIIVKTKKVDDVSFDTFLDDDFEESIKVSYGTDGSEKKFTVNTLSGGYRVRIYDYTNQDKVAFYLEYRVEDVLVLHRDVAELYWTFVPDGFEDTLQNVLVRVSLPKTDTSNYFRFWAHGNLDGEIIDLDDKTVEAKISEVLPGESVDIRLTFDTSIVDAKRVLKHSNVTALDGILEVETKRAEEANLLRDELISKRNRAIVLSFVLIGSILGLGVFIYFKYGKSPKSNYYSKYNREFIDEYNVEVIDYLMHRKITPNALSASIMNLIYKKNISVKELEKNRNYEFTLIHLDKLNDSEKLLVDFLFDTVGENKVNTENQKTFTLKDLKKYASGTKTCTSFIKSYTAWQANVLEHGKSENFFTDSGVPKIIGLFVLFVAIFLLMYIIHNQIDFIMSYVAIFLSVIFFIYTLVIYKKTKKGSEHFARWKAFRNFLDDFGSFELKELPEIILWERYLVYATIFGLADKVEASMNVHIKEINMNAEYVPVFTYIHISPFIYSSFNDAVSSAYNRQAANYANTHSSRSSGGGFGGGFSSGGGFGGGGGGGRFG